MKKILFVLFLLSSFFTERAFAQYENRKAMVVNFTDGTERVFFYDNYYIEYWYEVLGKDTVMVISKPAYANGTASLDNDSINVNRIKDVTFEYRPRLVATWLQSLEFIPQTIYGDMPAVLTSSLSYNWFTNVKS